MRTVKVFGIEIHPAPFTGNVLSEKTSWQHLAAAHKAGMRVEAVRNKDKNKYDYKMVGDI